MPTWQEAAEVAAAQRAEAQARIDAQQATGRRVSRTAAMVALDRYPDFDHPRPWRHSMFGPGDRGESLTVAYRLSQIHAERATLTAETPTRAADDRKRDARIRALDNEADSLDARLQASTASWWPDKPPAGSTAARQAAMPGVTAPGPAPRAFVPRR